MCSNDLVIPKKLSLVGRLVRLEPLAAHHAEDLQRYCSDPALWEYTFQINPFGTVTKARSWVEESVTAADEVPFAIIDRNTNEAIGSTRFLDIQPPHRKMEIGWTFVARHCWCSHVNTECKWLLLQYAFDKAGASRVQFKAEAINQRSRAALLRIGATHEGTLRNFRIRPDGEQRDVAFYSIIDREWPNVRESLSRKAKADVQVAN